MRTLAVSFVGCVIVSVVIAVTLAAPTAVAKNHGAPLYKPWQCHRIPPNDFGAVYYCEKYIKYSITYVYPGTPQYLDATYPAPTARAVRRSWPGMAG